MARERRKTARISKRLKVSYGAAGLVASGFGLDISTGGLFVTAGKLLPIGTRIHMHVETSPDFYVEGVVVRHKLTPADLRTIHPQGMGIRFLHPSELVEPLLVRADSKPTTAIPLHITCESPSSCEVLTREQLGRGVAIVPVGDLSPPAGERVEFVVHLAFLSPPMTFEGSGKVVQVLENVAQLVGGSRGAVLEVEEALHLIADIHAAVRAG